MEISIIVKNNIIKSSIEYDDMFILLVLGICDILDSRLVFDAKYWAGFKEIHSSADIHTIIRDARELLETVTSADDRIAFMTKLFDYLKRNPRKCNFGTMYDIEIVKDILGSHNLRAIMQR